MFNIGQKVIIIESLKNTSKRHPQVGDIGYLSKLFFYPKGKFLLAEIIFCQYAKDVRSSEFRKERKKFIIDVNMSKSLKHKIAKYGIERSYFMHGDGICISSSQYHIRNHTIIPDWRKTRNAAKAIITSKISSRLDNHNILFGVWSKSKLNNKVTIPVGQLALYNKPHNRKERFTSMPVDRACFELASWFTCIWPIIAALLFYDNNLERLPNDIYSTRQSVLEIYKHHLREYMVVKKNNNSKDVDINKSLLESSKLYISSFVENLRHAHAMSIIPVNKTYYYVAKYCMECFQRNGNIETVRTAWQKEGMEGMSNLQSLQTLQSSVIQLQHIFYRLIFSDINIVDIIAKLEPIIPGGDIHEIISEINDIKQKADNSSVALNRFYGMKIM